MRSAAFGGQFQININWSSTIFSTEKFSCTKAVPRWPNFSRSAGSCGKLQQSLRRDVGVAGADEEAGFIVEANFIRAVKIIGDDGFAGGEPLRQRARQGFTIGKMREAIHDANITRDFARRHEAGENNFAIEAKRVDLMLNFAAQRTVADEQQPRVRHLRQNFGKSGHQIGVALELEDAANFADDKMFSSRPSFWRSARSFVVFRNGSRLKPLKMRVNIAGFPMPAAR